MKRKRKRKRKRRKKVNINWRIKYLEILKLILTGILLKVAILV